MVLSIATAIVSYKGIMGCCRIKSMGKINDEISLARIIVMRRTHVGAM